MKLDAMLGYAEASTCRRRMLLAYFGEAVRGDCGNCDTCLDPPELWDATVSTRRRCCRPPSAPVSASAPGHLIDVLLGKRTPKVESWEHDELPTFGVGADVSERRVAQRGAPARRARHAERPTPPRMGALTVAEAARPVLDGTTTVELRRVCAPVRRVRKERTARGAGVSADVSDDGRALFERLRSVRRELADAEEVPAYVVLPDRTLWELVAARPAPPTPCSPSTESGRSRPRSTARRCSPCSMAEAPSAPSVPARPIPSPLSVVGPVAHTGRHVGRQPSRGHPR